MILFMKINLPAPMPCAALRFVIYLCVEGRKRSLSHLVEAPGRKASPDVSLYSGFRLIASDKGLIESQLVVCAHWNASTLTNNLLSFLLQQSDVDKPPQTLNDRFN